MAFKKKPTTPPPTIEENSAAEGVDKTSTTNQTQSIESTETVEPQHLQLALQDVTVEDLISQITWVEQIVRSSKLPGAKFAADDIKRSLLHFS